MYLRALPVAFIVLFNLACAVRAPQTYRLVNQDNRRTLIPPGVASADLSRRTFTAEIPAGPGKCEPAPAVSLLPRKKSVRVTVDRQALLLQPPAWLTQWSALAESQGCLASGGGIKLATRVVESLPLDPAIAYRLLHPGNILTGYVDLGPENRLQVNSPILSEDAAADTPAIESTKISGLTVEVKTSSGVIGFETNWYAIKPKNGAIGASIVPISAERSIQGKVEAIPTPSANHFQFSPQAGFYRLFYKTEQGATRILLVAAPTSAELDHHTQALEQDPNPCEKLPAQSCVLIPRQVAVNPDVVITVNGRELVLPVGATVGSAIRSAGDRNLSRVPEGLMVRRLYRGKLVAVEFAADDSGIMALNLAGGEAISWQPANP